MPEDFGNTVGSASRRESKICMLTPGSMLFDARIQKEAVALRDAGYAIKIYCIEDYKMLRDLVDADRQWKEYETFMGDIITRRHILISRRWRGIPKWANRICQSIEMGLFFLAAVIRTKANYYHCHDLIPALFACIGKWVHKGRIIYDAHEMETEMGGAQGLLRWMLRRYELLIMRQASAAITVNRYIKKLMEDRYGKHVTVIENRAHFVNNLPTGLLRQELNIPNNIKIVMYVGFLSMARGINFMVETMKFLPEYVHFYLMGTGRIAQFKDELTDLADEHGVVRDRIRFIGPFPPTQVIDYLCGADVSIMLYQTKYENMMINTPNKMFQSIAARVPIVASANKSFQSFLGKGDDRLGVTVKENDAESIARGVSLLLSESENASVRSNIEKVRRLYSWDHEKEKLLALYRAL